MGKSKFVIANVLPKKLNTLLENLMDQMNVYDSNKAISLINSGKWKPVETKIFFTTKTHIDVYDHGDHIKFTLPATTGITGSEWIKRLKAKSLPPSDYAKGLLCSIDFNFKPTKGVITSIVVLKGAKLKDHKRSTEDIRKFAKKRKLKIPNAEIACLIREMFTDEELKMMDFVNIVVMHKTLKLAPETRGLLGICMNSKNNSLQLNGFHDRPNDWWSDNTGFVFTISKDGYYNDNC